MMKNPEEVKKQVAEYETAILRQLALLIKEHRHKMKITVRELNAMTGVSIGVISDLENARCMPRLETILRISEVLDIPLSKLFDRMKPLGNNRVLKQGVTIADSLDKYGMLTSFLAGQGNSNYSEEDIAEIVSFARFVDYKKQSNSLN